jgi:hypothetical protein
VTDGTRGGTKQLTHFNSAAYRQFKLTPYAGTIFFSVTSNDAASSGLWMLRPDGGITALNSSSPGIGARDADTAIVDNRLYFTASGELHVTDGTVAGTRGLGRRAEQLVAADHSLYFTSGEQLWISDPTRGSLEMSVFSEVNANGVRESGEWFLSGYRVWIDLDRDGVRDSREPSLVTDESGRCYFPSLPAGQYSVRLVAPPGWHATTPLVSMVSVSGDRTSRVRFGGLQQTAVIRGIVFLDVDGDGVRDTREPPRSSVRVFLDYDRDGQIDPGEPTATTNSVGAYRFENLPARFDVRLAVAPRLGGRATDAGGSLRLQPGANIFHPIGVTTSI